MGKVCNGFLPQLTMRRKEVHDGYQGSNMQFGDYGYAVVEVTDNLYFHMTLTHCYCTYEPYLQEVSVKNALSPVAVVIKM